MSEEVKINQEAVVDNVEAVEPVRTPRGSEDREVHQRVESWENPSNLPSPDPQPGWVFRWIRTSLLGNTDNPNVSKKFREGWQPCRAEDHPEITLVAVENEKFADNVVIGGLMLCKAPQELVAERTDYYKQQTDNQIHSVDNNLMRENDPRMPIFNDRKSKVTFGKGN